MGNELSKEAQLLPEKEEYSEQEEEEEQQQQQQQQQQAIVMAETNSSTPATSNDTPTRDRVPVVVPASPILKARKKPMPWDSDFGTDGSSDSSLERLIKWLLKDGHYKQWRNGVGSSGETVTKKALAEQFLDELAKAGIDHRKAADVHTKIYEMERNFESAREWIATNKPDQEDSALHDQATRAGVVSKCKYYYRIEPVFGEYFGFSKGTRRSQTPKKKIANAPSFSLAPAPLASSPVASASIAPAATLANLQALLNTASTSPQASSDNDISRFASQLETALKKHQQQQNPGTPPTSSSTTVPAAPQSNPSTQSSLPSLVNNTGISTAPRLTTLSSQSPPPLSASSTAAAAAAAAQASTTTAPIGMNTAPLSYHEPNDAELMYQSIMSKERVALERLRLKEKKHNDRMAIKKRKLDLLEFETTKELDIKKRKATAEILGAHAQLISELRSLGLANSDIIDYMKKVENA